MQTINKTVHPTFCSALPKILRKYIFGRTPENAGKTRGHISPLAKFDNKEIIGTGASLLLTTFKIFYNNRICQAILKRGGLTIRINPTSHKLL